MAVRLGDVPDSAAPMSSELSWTCPGSVDGWFILLVATIATLGPAMRVARIDPLESIRVE